MASEIQELRREIAALRNQLDQGLWAAQVALAKISPEAAITMQSRVGVSSRGDYDGPADPAAEYRRFVLQAIEKNRGRIPKSLGVPDDDPGWE